MCIRDSLKTGAYRPIALAQAVLLASKYKLDMLTVDGAGGGTGMSPWRMMNEWGVPPVELHSLCYRYVKQLSEKGMHVPAITVAGGFTFEDQIFKGLAMGAPFAKAVCMGRALMIPGMVGKNIGLWLQEGTNALPKTVSQFGSKVEEIFICYEDLVARYGKDTVAEIPLGAIALYTFVDKLKVGLQQLMAGSRNFKVSTISRDDVMALTPEAAQVSGIPYIMDAYREEAEKIING